MAAFPQTCKGSISSCGLEQERSVLWNVFPFRSAGDLKFCARSHSNRSYSWFCTPPLWFCTTLLLLLLYPFFISRKDCYANVPGTLTTDGYSCKVGRQLLIYSTPGGTYVYTKSFLFVHKSIGFLIDLFYSTSKESTHISFFFIFDPRQKPGSDSKPKVWRRLVGSTSSCTQGRIWIAFKFKTLIGLY